MAVTNQKEAGSISRRTGKAVGLVIPEPLLAADRSGISRTGSTGVIVDFIRSAVLEGNRALLLRSSARSQPDDEWVNPKKPLKQ
jgi:hypothetical protein